MNAKSKEIGQWSCEVTSKGPIQSWPIGSFYEMHRMQLFTDAHQAVQPGKVFIWNHLRTHLIIIPNSVVSM
jgi:hypothetical protein